MSKNSNAIKLPIVRECDVGGTKYIIREIIKEGPDSDNNLTCKVVLTMNFLNINELCQLLQISKPTAYNLIHSQGFPKVKIGRAWRFDEGEVSRWIKEKMIENY